VTLTAADVAEIMRLVEQSGFDEVYLEVDEIKLSLRRGASTEDAAPFGAAGALAPGRTPARRDLQQTAGSGIDAAGGKGTGASAGPGASPATSTAPPREAALAPAVAVAGPASASSAQTPADPHIHSVLSPLLGTFYRAPKPGAPPFVDIGSIVEENTVVAIIEVMKLMNTVRAGVRGTVTEILLTDGALAEYDQPLLRVRKAAG